MQKPPRRLVVEGERIVDLLEQVESEGPVGLQLEGVELGHERPFRARIVVVEGRVPSGTEAETTRWLQIACWTPRVEVSIEPVASRGGGARTKDLWTQALERCVDVELPLERIGGPLTVLVADLDRLTQQLDTWPPEVGPILRYIDGVRPVLGVLAKAPFEPNVTVRILARLVNGGVLLVGSREPEGREAVVSPEPIED